MDRKLTFIWLLVIGILIGFIFFSRPKPIVKYQIKHNTIVRVDTVKIPFVTKGDKPKPILILDSGINEIRVYKREILNDTLGKLEIIDTVHNNQLLGYTVTGKINQIREVKNFFKYESLEEKNKFILGANFIYAPNFISVFPSVSLVTKKGYAFSAGYDPLNKIYYLGIGKQIKF